MRPMNCNKNKLNNSRNKLNSKKRQRASGGDQWQSQKKKNP